MSVLRTMSVLEHEVIPILTDDVLETEFVGHAGRTPFLTEHEAAALLRLNDQRRGFCQRVTDGVKLAQYCGVLRLETCVLEVLPKVGFDEGRTNDEVNRSRAALLTMLRHAGTVVITKIGDVPQQTVKAPLLDVFIRCFLENALKQAQRGLLSRYVEHEDDLPVVRGRFLAQGQVKHNVARPHLFRCNYDEFTADNAYNRAIRATLETCRLWIVSAATQRLWWETYARYASITTIRMTAADVVRLPRERMTKRYETVLTWCEWLLSMSTPAMAAGAHHSPGLLFDMNRLFEAYVGRLEEDAADESKIVRRQGPVEALAIQGQESAFPLKPDITIWSATPEGLLGNIDRIVDAKWKRLDPHVRYWGVDESDIYQLVAYAIRYRCQQLELVYPMPQIHDGSEHQLPIFDIPFDGVSGSNRIRIKVRIVPLW